MRGTAGRLAAVTAGVIALTGAPVAAAAPVAGAATAGAASASTVLPTDERSHAVPLNPCTSSDNGLPVESEPRFSSTAVDVTSAAARITFSIRVRDTGGPGPAAGVEEVRVWVSSPEGSWRRLDLHRRTDDTWARRFTVPQHVPAGTYSLHRLHLRDGAGNEVWRTTHAPYPEDRPHQPATFEVTSTPDTAAPRATALTLAPRKVTTTQRPRRVRFRVLATDDLAGVRQVSLDVRDRRVRLERSRGDVFTGSLQVRRWRGTGTWKIHRLTVTDRVGNGTSYAGRALRGLGQDRFLVVSRRDGTRPQLRNFRAAPPRVDVRNRGRTVRFVARLTDTRSGVRSAEVSAPDNLTSAQMVRTRGTARSGTWTGALRIPRCWKHGARVPLSLRVVDGGGNYLDIEPMRLRVRAGDNRAPTVTEQGHPRPVPGPFTFRFNEAVHGLRARSVSIHSDDGAMLGPELRGTWRCARRNGSPTSCRSGKVRSAAWTPEAPLESDATYRATFNPEHILDIRDLHGNPLRRNQLLFFTSAGRPSAVGATR